MGQETEDFTFSPSLIYFFKVKEIDLPQEPKEEDLDNCSTMKWSGVPCLRAVESNLVGAS